MHPNRNPPVTAEVRKIAPYQGPVISQESSIRPRSKATQEQRKLTQDLPVNSKADSTNIKPVWKQKTQKRQQPFPHISGRKKTKAETQK